MDNTLVKLPAIHEMHASSRIKTWLHRQTTALAIALAILAATGVVKWQSLLMPENTNVPMPQAPLPNARDYYNDAEKMLRGRHVFSNDEDAGLNDTQGVSPAVLADWKKGYDHLSPLGRQALVQINEPALAKLREGMKFAYLNPQNRSEKASFGYYRDDRFMAYLLSLEGDCFAAQSEWQGAESSHLDAIRLGSDVPKGSPMLGTLAGLAIQSIGRKSMQSVIPNLNAEQAESDARRLEAIDTSQVTAADALESEEWFGQGSMLDYFRSKSWRAYSIAELWVDGGATLSTQLQLRYESPRTAYYNYSRYMDSVISLNRLPWPQYHTSKTPSSPQDPINKIFLPVLSELPARLSGNAASNRLMEAQLALRAYYCDHQTYPSSLAELTPCYLSSVPIDPFSNNLPLHYKRDGSGYILYSIGPDAKDDGGTPAVDRQGKPVKSFDRIDSDATGDLVVKVDG